MHPSAATLRILVALGVCCRIVVDASDSSSSVPFFKKSWVGEGDTDVHSKTYFRIVQIFHICVIFDLHVQGSGFVLLLCYHVVCSGVKIE